MGIGAVAGWAPSPEIVRGRERGSQRAAVASALVFVADKDFVRSMEEHKNALASRVKLVAMLPNRPDVRGEAAASHSNLAGVLMLQKRPADAVAELQQAEKLLTGLDAPQQRFYLGQAQGNLAVARELLGQDEAALAAHRTALVTFRALAADFSAVPEYRHVLGRQLVNMARYLGPRGRSAETLAHLKEAIPILETLTNQVPAAAAYRADLLIARHCLALVEEDLRNSAKGKK